MRQLFWCASAISLAYASETVFSVQDDVLAYPQYEIVYPESYISEGDAVRKVGGALKTSPATPHDQAQRQLSDSGSLGKEEGYSQNPEPVEDYERLVLDGRPFLCSIPRTDDVSKEEKPDATSTADQERDLVTAADRGWELLRDLEGKCLFFFSGWWSYSFCHNSQIKQFHQLPPGSGGPIYPPQEDPSTPSYVLGRVSGKRRDEPEGERKSSVSRELQAKGETRYLVQNIGGGTTCDLTGKERRVEVQFHCHPQSTDRIGWIKEVATCAYLMTIYTPRLCNDIAFLPPRQSKAHIISCREILKPDEVSEWEKRKSAEAAMTLIGEGRTASLIAGNVEIGAMKEVGREGRRIQKGKVVSPPEEKIEVVAIQRNGRLQRLSKDELRKLDLNPETVETFRKKIQDLAGDNDWKVEKMDDDQGTTQLRGIIAGEDEDQEADNSRDEGEDQNEDGSQEVYKEDI